MNDRAVTYERTLTGSYMKIEAPAEGDFEERIILKRRIDGLLPVQRCFLDGSSWYWYDISGKQSLETFCGVKPIDHSFMERLIVGVCDEIELLEWNLLDQNHLLLKPEQIFMENGSQRLFFAFCPGLQSDLSLQFRQLMEYLLTKIDHRNREAVQIAYTLYERTLDEAYGLMDLRASVQESRNGRAKERAECAASGAKDRVTNEQIERTCAEGADVLTAGDEKNHSEDRFDRLLRMLSDWQRKWKEKIRFFKRRNGETAKTAYMPTVVPEEQGNGTVPGFFGGDTICLSDFEGRERGMLRCDSPDLSKDILLEPGEITVGSSAEADAVICKNTVSRIHARIFYRENAFFLEDLNSTNGTYVNGEMLAYRQERRLSSNDTVRFADISYRFLYQG